MKRFHELTKPQQDKAIALAKIEMKECVELGLIQFPHKPTESVITDYSMQAAEGAFYSEAGDRIIDDVVTE